MLVSGRLPRNSDCNCKYRRRTSVFLLNSQMRACERIEHTIAVVLTLEFVWMCLHSGLLVCSVVEYAGFHFFLSLYLSLASSGFRTGCMYKIRSPEVYTCILLKKRIIHELKTNVALYYYFFLRLGDDILHCLLKGKFQRWSKASSSLFTV